MLIYSAASTGSPGAAWRLIAEPAQWHRWAPHIRGATGLGAPEVEAGCSGLVLLMPALPVPAHITDKRTGHWWDWRVGPVEMRHRVEATPTGCTVCIELAAAAPVELAMRVSYGPVIRLVVRNLARIAAQPA